MTRPIDATILAALARVDRPVDAARLEALAWWDWSHGQLRDALDDFRALPIDEFLMRYEARR